MSVIAWDTETALIRPACLAPELVCVTWQRAGEDARIAHVSEAEPLLRAWLESGDTLVGHNVAYDLAVVAQRFPALLPAIFRAYDADRITDTMIRQQLLDIAGGVYRGRVVGRGRWVTHEYTLEALAQRCAGMRLQKDAWRLSYAEFLDVPLAGWPARAREVQARARARAAELEATPHGGNTPEEKALRKELDGLRAMIEGPPERVSEYPLDDARATLAVYQAQEQHLDYLADQFRQARAAFALHLFAAWGLRTSPDAVDILRRETTELRDEVFAELLEAGLVRPDGSRDTKAAAARMIEVCRAERLTLRRTASHTDECTEPDCHIALDADACAATGDHVLEAYAELSTLTKVLSNDVQALQRGTLYPIHTRYGLAETGRTTSSGPNIQNWVRARKCKRCNAKGCPSCHGGYLAGARECFVPRPGCVFFQADYPQLELYTLAQCCVSWLGESKLADAINRGLDPHLHVAAQILGISYEEAAANKKRPDVDAARQTAKVLNFGLPGGLGVAKFVLFARKSYGVTLTEAEAKVLKAKWFEAWPEMPKYFARVNALCEAGGGEALVETLWTQRLRGRTSYTAACNTGFQALGVDCAKRAATLLARAAYTEQASPLFGARIVAFVHDEFIGECVDDARAHDVAHELARLMVVGANAYLPDVPIPVERMEPLLMRRWSKKAVPVLGTDGRLVPWE